MEFIVVLFCGSTVLGREGGAQFAGRLLPLKQGPFDPQGS